MKTVLFVGAGRHQRHAIVRAKERGLRVLAVDRNPDALGLTIADIGFVVDFSDVAAVLEAVEGESSTGVRCRRRGAVVAAIAEARGRARARRVAVDRNPDALGFARPIEVRGRLLGRRRVLQRSRSSSTAC